MSLILNSTQVPWLRSPGFFALCVAVSVIFLLCFHSDVVVGRAAKAQTATPRASKTPLLSMPCISKSTVQSPQPATLPFSTHQGSTDP
jgi:hypothetical protein